MRLVEARPKSGYFVTRPPAAPALAALGAPAPVVGICGPVTEILRMTRASCRVRLDIATGPAEIYPIAELQKLMHALSRRRPELLASYPMGIGDTELRAQLARRALDYGCRLKLDDIVVTNGSTEALNLALRAVT